jgi:phosphoribosylanthranilate isomerase
MILKICGITCQADADAAVAAGATAIGFNFYPRSPRYVSPEHAAGIRTAPGIRRVGVFVNETRAVLERTVQVAALDVVQLHGDEGPQDFPDGAAVWKGLRVSAGFDFAQLVGFPAEAFVLDGPAGSLYGGAGKEFDWRLAAGAPRRVILAGGLDASNVAAAVAQARPWGVDACSRIETAPGKKDYKKMRDFLEAAKAALGA